MCECSVKLISYLAISLEKEILSFSDCNDPHPSEIA
jgi:hypothetical protein